ncbi:MAG TPA: peptidoglycan -binding protein [Aestuariivirgaceae bacterium]|jgi:chemotaxis protein MotB|nr:peptidoglycan -binding protein [Aestuariivirgaceae bacterium]
MARSLGRFRREDAYYWPGFVDAMAQLLLVITFLMSVFMITQFLLSREISGRDTVLSRLKAQIAELTQLLALEKSTKTELETSLAALTDDLQTARADNSKLKGMVDSFTLKENTDSSALTGLRGQLDAERKISSEAMARIELLNQQIAALRRQIAALNEALEAAEARDQDSKTQIADLGRRLNVALAQRVQELARYRSEFFGRLRQILSQRSDIRVVGDRFVFQSEVLFPKGSAEINPAGRLELDKLASAMKELETEIPQDIAWVLRVDGHTDTDPIQTSAFSSNWELSAARAIAVVKELIAQGVSPKRLVAAGFGEYQPIEQGDTEEIKTRNRRIELKLTER